MKRSLIVLLALTILGLAACNKKEETKPVSAEGAHTGKVLEKMNASNYTYLLLEENGAQYWAAVPQMQIEKGETVQFSKSMEMKNFHSESLNRTFESILFVSDVQKNGETAQPTMAPHPQVIAKQEKVAIEPLKGGMTVAEILLQKESLAGKNVSIRGKVTKFNPGIMGRNWIHLQDGTSTAGNYDLMVTSNDMVQVGDIIVVNGKIAVNRDFGNGYSYPVMLEEAKVKK